MHIILAAIAGLLITVFGHTILTLLWVIITGFISGMIAALPWIICFGVGCLVIACIC